MESVDGKNGIRASIIVPVRNGTALLDGCLRRLVSEAGPRDEILVIDDHSTDSTLEVASRYPVRAHSCPEFRNGAAAARNRGAELGHGEFLLFVDHDVLIDEGSLESLLASFDDEDVAAVVGVYRPCDAELGIWSRIKDASVRLKHGRSGSEIHWFWTAFGAVRTAVFRSLGGFDEEKFHGATVEDMELGFRLSDRGHRIIQEFKATSRHCHRFTPWTLIRNDFLKSRDWSSVLVGHGPAHAQSHGATDSDELSALVCTNLGFAGLIMGCFSTAWLVVPGITFPFAGYLLRRDLAGVSHERGTVEMLVFFLIRLLLYPVVAFGAALGGLRAMGGGSR